jgi:hypothetical protein
MAYEDIAPLCSSLYILIVTLKNLLVVCKLEKYVRIMIRVFFTC